MHFLLQCIKIAYRFSTCSTFLLNDLLYRIKISESMPNAPNSANTVPNAIAVV